LPLRGKAMFTQSDIQAIFNPLPLTVENRIKQAIPALFEEEKEEDSRFYKYRWDFFGYCKDILDSTPWSMQQDIANAYILALRQQHERIDYENGELALDDLEYWQPGQVIQSWISIDAGHASGKTWLLAKFVSHFFDCFTPSIVYCFAPTSEQINDLLFKEIRVDRANRDLPGFVFPRDTRIKYKADHFVAGRATNNTNSTGTERTHGQHGKYLLFICDESEGIQDFTWDAIRSMASGGIVIVIFARNPRTTTCRAHSLRSAPRTRAFRISCLDVPNVIENREVIPNLARRNYILDMLDDYTEIVDRHNPDAYTFELPWDSGTIYKPQQEFLWRVLGIASENKAINTFCPYGRFDSAVERGQKDVFEFTDEHDKATFGVDAARYGGDFGTVYIHRGDWLWRSASFQTSDNMTFYTHIKTEMEKLVADGVVHIEVRIDAGGGWGAGVIDLLNYDLELKYRNMKDPWQIKSLMEYTTTREQREHIKEAVAMREAQEDNKWDNLIEFRVVEVNFDGVPTKGRDYLNLATEMYYHLGAAMQRIKVKNAPKSLRSDVCARPYGWGMKKGYSVKTLISKESFKKEHKRSPDDGDGAALAVVPSHILRLKPLLLPAG